jgi:hypothetical protein
MRWFPAIGRGVLVAGLLAATGCATVIEDDPAATGGGSGTVVTTPPPTSPATPEAGLALIEGELTTLSGKIATGDGDNESIGLIVTTWSEIRDEIEAERPELIRGFDATIEMAEFAVERTRPADADKASANLADYLDNYYGRS